MPPVILWILGAAGAAIVARWLAREARRVNDELDGVRAQPGRPASRARETSDARQSLERDPETGIYRPRRADS